MDKIVLFSPFLKMQKIQIRDLYLLEKSVDLVLGLLMPVQKLQRMFIWGIESSQGYIGIQGANDPKNLCMNDREFHLMFLYGKRIPSATYCIPPPGAAGRDGWHMIALSWAGAEYAFKWDHRPLLKFNHPMQVKDSDFPCPVFSIGSASAWNYLLDDVVIYKRRLSNDELDALFRSAF